MSVTAEEVLIVFQAKMDRFNAELRSSTALFQKSIDTQSRSIAKLEADIRRSSGQIGSTLKTMAGSIAGYFTGRELVGILDGFTRLQNHLKVAGLEGEELKATQDRLFASAQKYGVQLEGMAGLYSKLAGVQKDLGASNEQIFTVTTATAAALKIQGGTAEQAQGAMLGLSQILGSTKVDAQDYNQILDGMRPLLQAVAAGNDKWSGSVGKLTNDVKDSNVSTQEFFQALLKGSEILEGRATMATLTLSGSFTTLTNAITVYFGEADKANGITTAFASAIGMVADNLETIIPALAVIGTAIGGRFVAGALAGGTALKAISAYASIATTSLAGTALAARAAGTALLAAFGGPVGLAITALALGIGYLASQTSMTADEIDQLSDSNEQGRQTLARLRAEADGATGAIDAFGNSTDAAKNKMKGAAAVANMLARELFGVHGAALLAADALAAKNLAIAKDKSARNRDNDQRSPFAKLMGVKEGTTRADAYNRKVYDRSVVEAEATKKLTEGALKNAHKQQQETWRNANAAAGRGPVGAGGKDKKPKKPSGGGAKKPTGPSQEELAARAAAEQNRFDQDLIRAKMALTNDIDERAQYETELLSLDRDQQQADLNAKKELGAEDRKAQQAVIDQLYGKEGVLKTEVERLKAQQELDGNMSLSDEERAARQAVITAKYGEAQIVVDGNAQLLRQKILREENNQKLQEDNDLQQEMLSEKVNALRHEYGIAKTQAKRREIGLAIVDAEYQRQLGVIDSALLMEGINKADRELLEAKRANLAIERDRQADSAKRDTMGPLEKYLDESQKTGDQLDEEFQGIAVKGLNDLNDGLVDAIMNAESFGDVFKNVAKSIIADLLRIAIQQTLVNGLMNALGGGSSGYTGVVNFDGSPVGGGGGGGLGGVLGGIGKMLGFASGGYTGNGAPNQVAGVVHGGEYVFDAAATKRLGVGNLAALQNGIAMPGNLAMPDNLRAPSQSTQQAIVRIEVAEGQMFEPRVVEITGPVVVQGIQAAAGPLTNRAVNEVYRQSSRPRF